MKGWAPLVLAALLSVMTACAKSPERLVVRVLESFPHDERAFTQGLLYHEGKLLESTGLYGNSSLREVDIASGEVLRVRYLPGDIFGEGLALVNDELVLLTWREEMALRFHADTFEPLGADRYEGEGWGLCFDGEELWMSNGSSSLAVRHPESFAVRRRLAVRLEGEPLSRLNELECVGEHIYANVWQTDTIVRIAKRTGRVDAVIDAGGLLEPPERAAISPDAVLNGIAYVAERDIFLLTGKLWPRLFAVRFE